MAVLGVSFDTREQNSAFAEKQGYDFPLLCDTERAMGLAYGACESVEDAYPRRYTYVIDGAGRIEEALATRDPGAQAAELLQQL